MLVDGDRVALVVAPLAADQQVARREALQPEAGAARERDRGRVPGLDVGLDAVQAERADQFDDLVSRTGRDDFACLAACLVEGGELVGIFTISQIVRGYFQSAYLGYYASARLAGQGLMTEAMGLLLDLAFGPLSLHRLEANIQPGNAPSVALARGAGFRLEGYSPRYLLIGGRWRDHERYAITAEEWREH